MREDQFERLCGRLQQAPKIRTEDRARERRFLEAVYRVGRSGAQWRFPPAEHGPWSSVDQRFARWAGWASGSGRSRRWRTSPTRRA